MLARYTRLTSAGRQRQSDIADGSPPVARPARRAAERLAASLASRSALRRSVRFAEAWRFRLFQRHRHRRLTVERVDGVPLVILPEVFNPRLFRTGEMLARHMATVPLLPGARVLDLGCGSGIVSVFAAARGAAVVAVDINPEAVRCTRINALLQGLEDRVDARAGDLFEPVSGELFDLVLFNPPYLPGRPEELWEHAWRSEDALPRFLRGLPAVLAPDGRAILILSTVAEEALLTLDDSGCRVRVLAECQLLAERLLILELLP